MKLKLLFESIPPDWWPADVAAPPNSRMIFKTKIGSVYIFNAQTMRSQRWKQYRKEHGELERGHQKPSDITVFVRDTNKSHILTAEGHRTREIQLMNKNIVVKSVMENGRNDVHTIQVETLPAVGLTPIEFWVGPNDFITHFGNPITNVEYT